MATGTRTGQATLPPDHGYASGIGELRKGNPMLKMSSGSQGGQSALAGVEKVLVGRDPGDSDIPSSVRRSVRWMLGGALGTIVLGLFWLIVTIADKNAITGASGKKVTNSQFAGSVVEFFIAEFLIPTAFWLLMARFNRAGQKWARIVASVLCAFDTYLTFGVVNSLRGGQTLTVADLIYIVVWVAVWVMGLIAIALLWRGESSVYFGERSARR